MAQLNDTMIYGDLRVTGKIYGDSISAAHTHPASAITAGTFDAARIPAHTATTTAYGAATTANYGHVKITSGNLNGKTYSAGEAAAAAHTHSQYLTAHQSITGKADIKHDSNTTAYGVGTTANYGHVKIVSGNMNTSTYSSYSAGVAAAAAHTHSQYLTAHQSITGKEDKSNKVTAWSTTTTDTNYPSEKLVKGSLDGKAPTSHVSSATTYGVGVTTAYGHVKIVSGNMNTSTYSSYSAGVAAAAAHTHSQYLTAHQSITGKADKKHDDSTTAYGVGTTANYGHVKIASGNMNTSTYSSYSAGIAAAAAHTHSQYLTAHQSITGKADKKHDDSTTAYGVGTTANYGHVKIVSGNMNTSTYSSYSAGIAAAAAHTHSQYLTAHQSITGKEDKSNKVTAWSTTTTDTNYPSEKLVKGALDGKAPTSHAVTATTYGVGTTTAYGHVKILSGNMNGKTYAAGEAAAAAHTHSNYSTTDNKVKQTLITANGEYPIILKNSTTATDSPEAIANYAAGVTVNPSAKTVSASAFIGNLSGTANIAKAYDTSFTGTNSINTGKVNRYILTYTTATNPGDGEYHDWNDLTGTGIYELKGDTGSVSVHAPNNPETGRMTLFVINSDTYVKQLAFGDDLYIRTKKTDGTWQPSARWDHLVRSPNTYEIMVTNTAGTDSNTIYFV